MPLFFMTVVLLHITRKNFVATMAYGAQSFIIVLLLLDSFLATGAFSFLFIALLGLVVKVIFARSFFMRLIHKEQLKFSAGSYANVPETPVIVSVLVAFAYSPIFTPLVTLIPANQPFLSLALATLFLSFFLIINRKEAFSQILGVLSLENSIVAFGLFSVLYQSLILEIGIIFSISVWIVIATVFLSMIYRHFGSLDVTEMKHLID